MTGLKSTVEAGMTTAKGCFLTIAFLGVALLCGQSLAAGGASSLSWRGVNIGMTRLEAASRLRELGFIPQPIQWGGRGQESWEGIMPAFPKTGECLNESGGQCEEAFLSIVRDPSGQEVVWVISAYSRLAEPTYVERLLEPAFDRYGSQYTVDWRNGYKMPDGSIQYQLWNGYWYPNGPPDNGQIRISTSVFPLQTINPRDPVPPVPDKDARAWGVNVIVSDSRILQRMQQEYDDRDRNLPPPVRY
jgi:hypothetical protein